MHSKNACLFSLITFITPFTSHNAKYPNPVILSEKYILQSLYIYIYMFRPRRVDVRRLFRILDHIIVFDLYWSPRVGIVK
jgi:hypothetical protein